MTTLAEAIREVSDRLLEVRSDGANPLQVREQVKTRYPELVEDEAGALIDRKLLDMARAVLRPSSAQQQEIPGFGGLPETFTVPDGEGDFRYVALKHANLGHEQSDLGVKRLNLEACRAEFTKAENRHDRLWSAPGAHVGMSVIEAARLVAEAETDK